MKARMAALDLWATQHFQRFNVRKCGIMVTARAGFVKELMSIPEAQRWWRLGGPRARTGAGHGYPRSLDDDALMQGHVLVHSPAVDLQAAL